MRASRKHHKRVHDHVAAALAAMPNPFAGIGVDNLRLESLRPPRPMPSARVANVEFIVRCDHADDECDIADIATGIIEQEPDLTDEQVARRVADIITEGESK